MNPLRWRREHQLAFVSSALLGSSIGGLLFILVLAETYYPPLWCGFGSHGWTCWVNGYVVRVMMWVTLGALVGLAIVYIRQLLRA